MPIIVHQGKAHADDFLATCVCLFKLEEKAFRLPFSEEMLCNSDFWVLDQGGRFEPHLHNFDHHHLNEEICSFTMILDYFYEKNYREYMPDLKFIEIYDSYGSLKATEFAKHDLIKSPIHWSMLKAFSKIDGVIEDPFLSIMKLIGKEICEKIENMQIFLSILDKNSVICDLNEIKILDITRCDAPDNFTPDSFPTKIWCKLNKINPVVILTQDSRKQGSYRMVSVNTNSIKFVPNEKSYFTHVSGFLTCFDNYQDHIEILQKYIIKNQT